MFHIADQLSVKHTTKNSQGFSLIEVLVASGIMIVVLYATSSMISNQFREGKAVGEKMASLDLERLLISSLSNGSICSAELASTVFNAHGPYKINTQSLATQIIVLPSLHASKLASAPTLIAVNETASSLSQSLKIDSIQFTNFSSAGLPDLYLTDLVVSTKDGIRSLKPITIKMLLETNPLDPANAKSIIDCNETGKSDRSYRFIFDTTQTWTVPNGVRSAFVTMAGGGGSGAGWRLMTAIHSGHSGGYVFSHPVNLVSGEVINIVIGKGGKGYSPYAAGPAALGPPYYIYMNPAGDDGTGGYPGESTQIISPSAGILLECSGGSGATIGGIDSYSSATPVAGNLDGANFGGGSPVYSAAYRPATGTYAHPGGPGACGPNNYGLGNTGIKIFGSSNPGPPSGNYPGATTPFGFGAGGDVFRTGCYVTSTTTGTCTMPADGRNGVVYIDVRY